MGSSEELNQERFLGWVLARYGSDARDRCRAELLAHAEEHPSAVLTRVLQEIHRLNPPNGVSQLHFNTE
jgi:hypothetical protein